MAYVFLQGAIGSERDGGMLWKGAGSMAGWGWTPLPPLAPLPPLLCGLAELSWIHLLCDLSQVAFLPG